MTQGITDNQYIKGEQKNLPQGCCLHFVKPPPLWVFLTPFLWLNFPSFFLTLSLFKFDTWDLNLVLLCFKTFGKYLQHKINKPRYLITARKLVVVSVYYLVLYCAWYDMGAAQYLIYTIKWCWWWLRLEGLIQSWLWFIINTETSPPSAREAAMSDMQQLTFNNTTTLKYPHKSCPWNTLKKFLKLPWNLLERPLKVSWKILETLKKLPLNPSYKVFLNFLKTPQHFFETPLKFP